jgi:hypothetical protein
VLLSMLSEKRCSISWEWKTTCSQCLNRMLEAWRLARFLKEKVGKKFSFLTSAEVMKVFVCYCSLIGAFENSRKATFGLVILVRRSARNNSAATGRFLIMFGTWIFFENLPRKFNKS